MMPQFRKKPVVIEAVRFLAGSDREIEGSMPDWYRAARTMDAGETGAVLYVVSSCGSRLAIFTLEGEMTAQPGDWIIRGIKGEVYPCKPDIFAATYEPVE